jgi:hypothetical protein
VNADQEYHEEIRQDVEVEALARLQAMQPHVPEGVVHTVMSHTPTAGS